MVEIDGLYRMPSDFGRLGNGCACPVHRVDVPLHCKSDLLVQVVAERVEVLHINTNSCQDLCAA